MLCFGKGKTLQNEDGFYTVLAFLFHDFHDLFTALSLIYLFC